ncbi:hypothetical protein MHYP_G00219760 [Metynnis hypsauchen]
MRPTRHYTVFLCEDSSGDELPQDDDSVSAFPDHFLLSAPFEWPQPYRSLKEAELVEEAASRGSPRSLPARNSTLTCRSAPARSLEELSSVSETQEQRTNFNYQRMELSGDERTRTLPGLKHSSYNKLRSQKGPDDGTVSGRDSPCWERPLSVPPLEPPEPRPPSSEIPAPTQESTERTETGSITIPRPQGRKTPEPGTVLAPAITLLQGMRQGDKEVGLSVSAGGQEFRQALNMSPLSQPHPASADSEPDLLSLLDPLSGAEEPRPPPKPPRHYSPVAPSNPFSSTYVPPQTGTYFNSQPPRPLSVFGQPSVLGGTQASGAWPPAKVPPTSNSSSSLSSLLDSPAPPSLSQALPPSKPVDAPHDPFCDLLTMATMPTAVSTPPKKRVEDLRRRWETFD